MMIKTLQLSSGSRTTALCTSPSRHPGTQIQHRQAHIRSGPSRSPTKCSINRISSPSLRISYFARTKSPWTTIIQKTVSRTYTKLLTNILRGVGRSTEVPRITKCVHSHARSGLWQRSSLWLLIKVAIQTSLDHGGVGRVYYKSFMLHFMCYLAKHSINANLSSCLLHAISVKILRRLRKLGASSPDWLYDMVLKTNASLREILETRWKEVEAPHPLPSLWEPSQLDLDGDMQLSLLVNIFMTLSRMLTRNCLVLSSAPNIFLTALSTTSFLSLNGTFFEEAYNVSPYVTLYDVEQAVEQGIDDWVACVTDVDEACIQLEILMDKYLSSLLHRYQTYPEDIHQEFYKNLI